MSLWFIRIMLFSLAQCYISCFVNYFNYKIDSHLHLCHLILRPINKLVIISQDVTRLLTHDFQLSRSKLLLHIMSQQLTQILRKSNCFTSTSHNSTSYKNNQFETCLDEDCMSLISFTRGFTLRRTRELENSRSQLNITTRIVTRITSSGMQISLLTLNKNLIYNSKSFKTSSCEVKCWECLNELHKSKWIWFN